MFKERQHLAGNTFQGQKIVDYINLVSYTKCDAYCCGEVKAIGGPNHPPSLAVFEMSYEGPWNTLLHSQSSKSGRSPRLPSGIQRTAIPGISGRVLNSNVRITCHTWKENLLPLGRGDAAEGPKESGMTS